MPRRLIPLLTLTAALAGCGGRSGEAPAAAAPVAVGWRAVATPGDRERVRNWRTTWLAAVAEARRADPRAVAAEPLLFAPDGALADPLPPPGDYRCRTFKLGARGTAMLGFVAYPYFACRVDRAGLTKVTGSQRPVGRWYPDGSHRAVFLGTLALGDERGAIGYGGDPNRDLVGLVERVAARRWRIAFPEPRFESRLDVIELVPAE